MLSFFSAKVALDEIKVIVNEAKKTGIHLPSLSQIRDLLRKANEWLEKGEMFRRSHLSYPFLEEVESHVSKGESLPVALDQVAVYKGMIEECRKWRQVAAKTFLKKNTLITLVEVRH